MNFHCNKFISRNVNVSAVCTNNTVWFRYIAVLLHLQSKWKKMERNIKSRSIITLRR